VVLLDDVINEFEEITKELYYPAFTAYRNISNMLEKYDSKSRPSYPHLRHSYYSCIKQIRMYYDYQLTYQTGSCLVGQIRHSDVSNYKIEVDSKTSIYKFIKYIFMPDSSKIRSTTSEEFGINYENLIDSIPNEKASEIFKKTLELTSEYAGLHKNARSKLEKLENRLDKAIKKNNLEMIKISDMPNLREKFYRIKGDLGRFQELYFPDIQLLEGEVDVYMPNGIDISLYVGSVLMIASDYSSWGIYTRTNSAII
jgi:septin family protein